MKSWKMRIGGLLLAGALVIPVTSAVTGPSYAASDVGIYVQGKAVALDAKAQLDSGVTLVPLRNLAESLGASVEWDRSRQTATVTKEDTTVTLTVGQGTGMKNGSRFELGASPKLANDVLMVPVRAISETFDMLVRWDGANSSVYLDNVEQLPVIGSLDNLKNLMAESEASGQGGMYGIAFAAGQEKSVGAPTRNAAPAAPTPSAAAMDNATAAPAAGASTSSTASDFSKTNVQVDGVDEADVVKTDGRYIYQVNRQRVVIAEALPADRMKIVSSLDFSQGDKKQGEFYPLEMYVDDKHLVVIGNASRYPIQTDPLAGSTPNSSAPNTKMLVMPHPGAQTTKAIIYDLSDRSSLKQLREIELEGGYISSRKVGSALYLVTNRYLNYWILRNPQASAGSEPAAPSYRDTAVSNEMKTIDFKDIRYFPNAVDSNYMLVAGVNLDRMDQEAQVSTYLGSSRNIYASDKNLYVAVTRYQSVPLKDSAAPATSDSATTTDIAPGESKAMSVVYKFRLDAGKTQYIAQGEVPGNVLNQFSMDEYNGHFRIATTVGNPWGVNDNTSKNNVYVLDEGLKTVGKLENLAPGEKIYSVRFMGDRAYVVTFKTVDPLFVIDLKDPKSPSVLGALKIPGYSDYLHPYDENHIIGFGKDTIEQSSPDGKNSMGYYQGMKMAIFDVSDVTKPIEKYKEIIGDRGTDSDLLHNHKALLFSREKNLLAFPVQLHEIRDNSQTSSKMAAGGGAPPAYGEFVFQGAYVYNIDLTNGFKLKGRISHMTDADLKKTGMYGGDYDLSVQRILYIGDTLYTLSNAKIKANDMSTLAEEGSLIIP